MRFKLCSLFLTIIALNGCSLFMNADDVASPEWNYKVFWETFDQEYALFDQKGIDWDQVRENYQGDVDSTTSDIELFGTLKDMIDPLDDGHVTLTPFSYGSGLTEYTTDEDTYTYFTWYFDYSMESYLSSVVKKRDDNGALIYVSGRFTDNQEIAYIHIPKMATEFGGGTTLESWALDLDGVIDRLLGCTTIVIDLRGNSGGYSANAEHIVERFTDRKRLYMRSRVKNGPGKDDFSHYTDHYIEPRGKIFQGKVFLITDKGTMSAAEWMTLMLKTLPSVVHIGTTSHGALGMVNFHELPNGWQFSTTIGQTYDLDGKSYEGIGIDPDYSFSFNNDIVTYILDNP